MATHFINGADLSLGALPASIVHFLGAGTWTCTVVEDGGVRGIRFAANGGAADGQFAVFTGVGSQNQAASQEIVAHFKFVAGESADNFTPIISLLQNYAVDALGYCLCWDGGGTNDRFRIIRPNTGGTTVQTAYATYNWPAGNINVDTYYRVRLRRTSGGVLRARIVEGTSDAAELAVINALLTAATLPTVSTIDEAKDTPQAWHMSTSALSLYSDGYFSIGAYGHTQEPFYSLIGMATAGETAPTTGGGGGGGVTITNAGDEEFFAGETSVVIEGSGFGASQGTGKVYLSPSDNVADGGRVEQAVTAWSNTSVTITVAKGALSFLTNVYLFVVTDGGQNNAAGYVAQIAPRVYIRESVVGLSGSAAALNGEALLVWRARPAAGNPNPNQIIVLGSIPTGVIDVEITRGSLAPGDPVWAMLVSAAGNDASAKRIVPDYE